MVPDHLCTTPTTSYQHIATLRAGGDKVVFGELALISDHHRMATVRAEEDSELLLVQKEDFDGLLKKSLHEDLHAKVATLRKFDLFKAMNDTYIKRISLYFERQVFGPGVEMARQGEPANQVFFLVSGEAEIIQAIKVKKDGVPIDSEGEQTNEVNR